MVSATIRAQELAEQAEAAKARAEESERELQAVAEFREMFIGILGHDLRNPVSVDQHVGGLVASARQSRREGRAAAARIIRASQRMTRMIAQLLDLTRARLGGGLPIEPQADRSA